MAKLTGITKIGTNRQNTQELPIQGGGDGVIDFPDWDSADAFDYDLVVDAYSSQLTKSLTKISEQLTYITSPGGALFKGVVAENGFIYFAPNASSHFRKLDLSDDTFTNVAANPGGTWYGFTLASNGIIYALNDSGAFIKIDPSTDTLTTITNIGANSYISLIEAPNGMIYSIPQNETQILKFNPNTETISYFGSLAGSGKWNSGCLGPDGIIYGAPWNSSSVLKIDTNTDTASVFGSISGSFKFGDIKMGPNNQAYLIPYNASYVYIVDTETESVKSIGGPSIAASDGYYGGCFSHTMRLFIAPFSSAYIAKVNGHNVSQELIEPFIGSTQFKNSYPVLAPNGFIYFPNTAGGDLIKFSPSKNTIDINFCMNPYFRTV
jgi:streptogramin lyase